ncbi:Glutamate--tRNA ligase [Buchnera aphidicola (Cinara kochiana kochiana)]|uniref:Glutamate--tRNA ligase n=1 Tax=Buchnera aphidicola (Cinara kochiana kochiana) TaxID=2518976 RepID=A0A451D598_9GAMM|nr:glutamate--tRNA ligase [Buchnera aphidicola]VFP80963.1 Glutamate--tRNA ligase [Buchnera aphidicola (Cinara kochiana kochiana)]
MKVKTRFSPSPTGCLHIGGARTALYSWLFARKYNGSFVLRIEDTDVKRVNDNYVQDILYGLSYLKLNWDEGPFYQSNRLNIYKNIILFMLKKGIAYKCYCSQERLDKLRKNQILNKQKPRYDRQCREYCALLKKSNIPFVVRFKNPINGFVQFTDMIRGLICISNYELDDFIIQRSNGMPTYNFCVVIDDWKMNITHVIRGEDHINNTPRQINLLNSLCAPIPLYAHVSMILDDSGVKLSKRNKSKSITSYIREGFIPEAILNYILRLGWSYKDQEIFSINEMQNLFNMENISKSPSMINDKRLLWLNHYYLNNLSTETINSYFFTYCKSNKIFLDESIDIQNLLKEFLCHHNTLEEFISSYLYLYKDINLSNVDNIQTYCNSINIKILKFLYKKFFLLTCWYKSDILLLLKQLTKKFNVCFKNIATLIRIGIAGRKNTPNISTIIFYIGKNKFLLRINNLIKYMQSYILI